MSVARTEQEGRRASASPSTTTKGSSTLGDARLGWRWLRQCVRVLVVAISLNLLAELGNAYADPPPLSLGNKVQVENAYATSGPAGKSTEVRFRLINDSGASVVLLGVSSRIAKNSRLVARIEDQATTELQSISVPAGEVLDLTTSHLWYELCPLERNLDAGEVFELELSFVNARIVAEVHVHSEMGEQKSSRMIDC